METSPLTEQHALVKPEQLQICQGRFCPPEGRVKCWKEGRKKKKEKRFAHFLVRSSFQFNPQCCVTIVRRSSPVSLPAINITDYSPITQITRVQAGSELLSVSKTECYQRSFWRLNTQCFVFIALQLMATQGLDTRTTWKRGRQAWSLQMKKKARILVKGTRSGPRCCSDTEQLFPHQIGQPE